MVMPQFDYVNKSTDQLGLFCENDSDKGQNVTFFPTESFMREYNLPACIKMQSIWTVPVYYPETDVISYCIKAYKGAGIFAVLDYEHSNFGVFTDRPSKRDYKI